MENKIYSVVEVSMDWSNDYEITIKAFRDKSKAEKFKEELEKSYENPHLFESEEEFEAWDNASNLTQDILAVRFKQFLDNNNIPYGIDKRTEDQTKLIGEYLEHQQPKIEVQETLKILDNQFPGRWTEEDVRKMYRWESFNGYPPYAKIEEIPFEE